MDLINMTYEERYAMMHKRYTFLSETVKGYTSLDEYARDKDEWFAILGIALFNGIEYISLCNYIGMNDYETYHIVPTADGRLAVSHVIWWQTPICYNEILNIFTHETVEDEDILTSY